MMSATADRDRKPLIPLSEEMSYVDAYLYIIQCRFGDAFTCTISVPEEIGNYLVPRLIIQPVIENAVEHGRDESGRGRVSLTIEGGENEQADLLITILNKGEPSIDDRTGWTWQYQVCNIYQKMTICAILKESAFE